MKKIKSINSYPSFMLFMMSLCFGFIGLFLPWSSAYFRTLPVGASMYQLMGHPLSFWQTSFFGLVFRQAPCRTWIISQANTPQGNILNLVQTTGFSFLSILVFLWLIFLWKNRNVMTQEQSKQLLQLGIFLFAIGALVVARMATFADCSLIQSIELLNIHFLWMSLLFPLFSMLYGIIAILKSRTTRKEIESVQ